MVNRYANVKSPRCYKELMTRSVNTRSAGTFNEIKVRLMVNGSSRA